MTDGAIETVMERTRQDEIRLVRFLYADHGGIIRGKAAGTARLRERMSSGIGHTVAMMAMSMLDQLQPVPGMGPVGEVRIVPDPETFVALPYAPGAGAMLADLVKTDGSPWEACPRTFLKQALAELAGQGYGMQAAFEPEFTVGQLRAVYEAVWGHPLDPRNFHRKVTKTPGFLEPTGRTSSVDGGRPAMLYRRGSLAILNPPLTRADAG